MENVKSSIFICFILIFIALSDSAAAQQQKRPQLRQDEVRALKEIAKQVGKNDWDFSKDPCSGEGNWSMPIIRKGFESSVTCDCTFDQNSTCHVISIALKSQNLTGRIPQEFSKFRHLTHLDLSRNDFNGSIPLQWGKMNLVDLSVMGNRLSGPFPEAITKMNTLVNLSLEGNQFSGPIPSRIRSLVNLEKFVLSSNAFTGDLPVALSKLTSLIDLRLSDNNFTGQIPDYIGNWTQIEKLHFQGCSIKGPIPSSISALTKLADLRISDLTGGGSTFPALSNLKSLKVLVLRSCLLQGQIPDYIGDMKKLKTLDLSFNNLTGRIPDSFSHLTKVDFLYLTGNDLTGRIPRWIVERNKNALVSSIELHYSAFLSLFSSSFNIAVRYLIQVRTNQKRGNLKRILTSYQKPIIFIWFLDQQCTALVKQAEDCKHQKGVFVGMHI